MKIPKIFYVCEPRYLESPESCGHPDRHHLRVAPSGRWLCNDCWDEDPETRRKVEWRTSPIPPEQK